MQFTCLSEISPTIPKYSRVATTYEAYFSHIVPRYATTKYSQRTLTDMLHNAIVMGEPVPEFRDHALSNYMDVNINLPPRPQEHREMFRDWYLHEYCRP
jgi:hypothetical protein